MKIKCRECGVINKNGVGEALIEFYCPACFNMLMQEYKELIKLGYIFEEENK